jgi:hypothetical protein
MNLRRVAAWAAVFGLLLIYVIVYERETPQPEATPPQEALAARLFSFSGEQVREVRIVSGPHAMRCIRKAGSWETDPLGRYTITSEMIENLINTLLDTTTIDVVAQQPANLEQFGLAAPPTHITMLLENEHNPVVLRLGAVAPSQVSMYAQVAHEPGVVLIGTYLSFSIRTFLDKAGLQSGS